MPPRTPKKILERRMGPSGLEEFFVEWENSPVKTWEVRSAIPNAALLIKQFEGQLFAVQAIPDCKVQKGKKVYLVKWKGYTETTWEPSSSFANKKMLIDFEKKMKATTSTPSTSRSSGQVSSKKRGNKRN